MSFSLPNPKNPLYGNGVFRRRIVYKVEAWGARIWLFDDFHDMDLAIAVAEGRVSDISASMRRYPKDTCPGAVAKLQAIRGIEVSNGQAGVRLVDKSRQCTHLHDLAGLTLSALARRSRDYLAEIYVADEDCAGQSIGVAIDGANQLDLIVKAGTIQMPESMCGSSLGEQFKQSLSSDTNGLKTDVWRMAQIAYFVSRGRRWIVDGSPRTRVGEEPAREGACHSYSRPSFPDSLSMVNYVANHTDGLPPITVVPWHSFEPGTM